MRVAVWTAAFLAGLTMLALTMMATVSLFDAAAETAVLDYSE